jgi:hypothetical protein
MIQATKATTKRLRAAAEGREYWSIPATLLRAIEQATEDARTCAECKQYDAMDEYNAYWGYNGGRAYYSAEGLVYRPTRGCQDEYNAHGLAYKYPELVRYLCTHDLNMVIISDINKLVKAILADEIVIEDAVVIDIIY